MREAGRRVARVAGRRAYVLAAWAGASIKSRWFPDRRRPPLYDGSVFDDLLHGQPLSVVPRVALAVGRRRRTRDTGVSVVIVNYETKALLGTVLDAVRRFTPADTEVVVVDNGSHDGSRAWLRTRPNGIRPVCLPVNIGHGRALDIGIARARSPIVVTLDSDAFPHSPEWLPTLLAPFEDPAVLAAGLRGRRDRLHPACAAFRRSDLLELRTSMSNYNLHKDLGEEPVFGVNSWDAGELVWERLGSSAVVLFPNLPTPFGGESLAGVLYHHTASTTITMELDQGDPAEHRKRWHRAVAELLPTIGPPPS